MSPLNFLYHARAILEIVIPTQAPRTRMTSFILLFGADSDFIDHASYHFAAAGLASFAVTREAELDAALARTPALVLVHWDTLGEACFRTCARLRTYLEARGVPVAIISEKLAGGVDILTAFSSGADALIEGAHNPRILIPRVVALLGRRTKSSSSARSGDPRSDTLRISGTDR
jgi:DNA-binding response OmpR family regulator